ncbi:MAG: hypothetical protein VW687_03175, partial [Curvibacter sp.]
DWRRGYFGVLGIIGLQGSAVKASVDAKYRSEAALLANDLIGRMWASDRTQATLQANYASTTNGALFLQWRNTVQAALPGAATNPPTVAIAASAGTVVPTSLVTITIFWQVPGEAAVHNYVAVAQVGG